MNIIFTVATYYPKTDGVQLVTQYQAEGLVKKGHKVTVITSKLKSSPDYEVHNGVEIVRVDAYNFYYWHKGNKKEYQNLVLEKTKAADALVAVCLQSFSADWLLDVLQQIKCKKILYLHGMPDFKVHLSDCSNLKKLAKTIFRNIRWKYFYTVHLNQIKKFDAITHLFKNDNSYKYFSKEGYKNNYVIENACNDDFFENIDFDNKKKNFLYVGNYCDRKNQELALKAFYDADLIDFGLVFIGSQKNDYCNKLINLNNSLKNQYGNHNVEILYGVPREKISEYTKNAYACVISSNYEYYPITIVESLAAGNPFISTDVGIVNLLPGGVIANTQEEISYWIEFFARNEEYKTELGKAGRNYALKNLRIETKVSSLEDIIRGE
ncbi:glycosyltransferase family 4 protein [Catenibacterium sp.]|uniref:glycosyltransferase family 4 protein n=1 Tax=Catenibacterium sp. TaxID=2049022 RepID=UPI002E763DE0|nr:glycosyltransferase family 4 protein [Catenibacterium sp.]MEE0042111.1 glycosyltransferase family 4 protein [Catenibacterium sp.]